MRLPYLIRFARRQDVLAARQGGECEYDHSRDYLRTHSGVPAVLDPEARPLTTKKMDLEKGEDQKDSWL